MLLPSPFFKISFGGDYQYLPPLVARPLIRCLKHILEPVKDFFEKCFLNPNPDWAAMGKVLRKEKGRKGVEKKCAHSAPTGAGARTYCVLRKGQ